MKTLEKWYVWGEDLKKLGSITNFLLSDGSFHVWDGDTYCWPSLAVAYTLGEKVESKRGAK